ncbi:hypothetical protein DFH06DRAFT_1134708 [Mycena polygramma]|nr:hypothetical protein DFH06DRAFT_1134708 [Mycena polygramma]
MDLKKQAESSSEDAQVRSQLRWPQTHETLVKHNRNSPEDRADQKPTEWKRQKWKDNPWEPHELATGSTKEEMTPVNLVPTPSGNPASTWNKRVSTRTVFAPRQVLTPQMFNHLRFGLLAPLIRYVSSKHQAPNAEMRELELESSWTGTLQILTNETWERTAQKLAHTLWAALSYPEGPTDESSSLIYQMPTQKGDTATTRIKHAPIRKRDAPPQPQGTLRWISVQSGVLQTQIKHILPTLRHEMQDSTSCAQEIEKELRKHLGVPIRINWEHAVKICTIRAKELSGIATVGWKSLEIELKFKNFSGIVKLGLENDTCQQEEAAQREKSRTESRTRLTCNHETLDSDHCGNSLSSAQKKSALSRQDPRRPRTWELFTTHDVCLWEPMPTQIDDRTGQHLRAMANSGQWEVRERQITTVRPKEKGPPVRIRTKTPLNKTAPLRHNDARTLNRHKQIPIELKSRRLDTPPTTFEGEPEEWPWPELPDPESAAQCSRFVESGNTSRKTRLPKEAWRDRQALATMSYYWGSTAYDAGDPGIRV